MKLPKTHPRSASGFVRRHSIPGLFSQSANEPPAGGAPTGGAPGSTDPKPVEGEPAVEPTFTQADLNKIGKREKEAGKRAAEQAFADQLGIPIDEAKKIIETHKAAEDAKKSEADRLKDAAAKEKSDADALKATSAGEVRTARIERALAAEKFPKIDDDKATAKVVRMLDVASDASYEDVREAVKDLKKDFPSLFEEAKDDGKNKKPPLPGSAPSGRPPTPPSDNESAFERGQRRFADEAKKRRGFNPFEKKNTTQDA